MAQRAVRGRELAETRVRDREESRKHRRREGVGLSLELIECLTQELCALPQLAVEHDADTEEGLGDRMRSRIPERFADGLGLLERVLSGDDEVLRGAPRVASLLKVHRDDRGELATAFRVQRKEGASRELVQRTPVLLEQRAVCGVLYESMPEEVLELRLHRGDLDQATCFERAEVSLRCHVVRASSRRSRIVRPNCRPTTEATRSVLRLSFGSRSIRSRRSPWRVSGISTPPTLAVAIQLLPSRRIAPWSMSIRMTSSTKNGFPSAFERMRSRVFCGSDSISRRFATRLRA